MVPLLSSHEVANCRAAALFTAGVVATLTIWTPGEWVGLLLQATFVVIAIGAVPLFGTPAWIGIFPLWGAIQLVVGSSPVPWITLRGTLHWLAIACVGWAAHSAFRAASIRRRYLRVAAQLAVTVCVFSLLQFFTSDGRHYWIWQGAEPQILGPFQSRNNFATFALLMTPLVVWQGLESHSGSFPWLAGAALMVGAVAASGSRAGAALMVLEIVTFAIVARRSFRRTTLLAGAASIAVSIAIAGWTHLAGKLNDSDPWRYRREMMASAMAMVKDRPWLGYGLSSYASVYPAYALFDSGHRVNYAHNDWAEWAAEGGVPFALMLIAAAASLIPASLRNPWALGLPFVCAHALVDYPFQRIGVMFWFIVIAAAAVRESATFGTARKSINDG